MGYMGQSSSPINRTHTSAFLQSPSQVLPNNIATGRLSSTLPVTLLVNQLNPHRTMKFFTAILSTLALTFAISTTSATPIDPRGPTSFSPSIMERQAALQPIQAVPGGDTTFVWDPKVFHEGLLLAQTFGDVILRTLSGTVDPSKLFSLPPPPRAPVASNSFSHPWLNWENLICVRPPHLVVLVTNVPASLGTAQYVIPADTPKGSPSSVCCKSPSCGLGSIP
jgi:hypothetical protein